MTSELIRADEFDQDLEDKVAPEGTYSLRITSAKPKLSKKTNRKMFSFGILIEGDQNYETVFHNVNFPLSDDVDRTKQSMKRDMKRFATVFHLPLDLFVQGSACSEEEFEETMAPELAALAGSEGKCLVVQEEARDANGNETGNMRNILRLPKAG